MDVFSYARLPPDPPERRLHSSAWLSAVAVCLAFVVAGRSVLETGSEPVLWAMSVVAVAASLVSLVLAQRTIVLEKRAAAMAADFEDQPPAALAESQVPLFRRLVAWHKHQEHVPSAMPAMLGGIALSAAPLVTMLPTIEPGLIWPVLGGAGGIFATILMTMATLNWLATRPVVGILARAQLQRLEEGSRPAASGESAERRAEAATSSRQAEPQRS